MDLSTGVSADEDDVSAGTDTDGMSAGADMSTNMDKDGVSMGVDMSMDLDGACTDDGSVDGVCTDLSLGMSMDEDDASMGTDMDGMSAGTDVHFPFLHFPFLLHFPPFLYYCDG